MEINGSMAVKRLRINGHVRPEHVVNKARFRNKETALGEFAGFDGVADSNVPLPESVLMELVPLSINGPAIRNNVARPKDRPRQ